MNSEQPSQFETEKTLVSNRRSQIELGIKIAIASMVLLGFGFVLGQRSSSPEATVEAIANQQTNILPVKTMAISPVTSYSSFQTYTGEVAAVRTSEVGFERGGKLIEVLVEEGDRLTRNTPLARLDTSNLEAQRRGLVAQKAQAKAVLAELSNGARSEQIAAAQANVRDLERQLELEKLKSSRREYLYDEGAIAREELDEISFRQKALNERLASAKSNLDELNNGTRIEQIQAQQAAVERLAAEVEDLEITISKSTLKSPYDGIVAAQNLDEGTVIQAGQSILRLVEDTQPQVKIGVPIAVANQIQPGSQQQLTIGSREYKATVSSILPEVNTATRTRTVVLNLFPSAATQVSPMQIARLKIKQDRNVEGYWLPINALVKGDRGLWSCYAVVDSEGKSIAERRYLELLETESDRVLVRGTVQPGDEIIIDGTHRLIPGQMVNKT